MIIIKDRVFARLMIAGEELPDTANLLQQIILTEGNGTLIPSMSMKLNDFGSVFTGDRAIVDGTKVEITVGKRPEDVQNVKREYRVFGGKSPNGGMGAQPSIVGILDSHSFITSSVRSSYKGRSDEALKRIASLCGLTFDGTENFNGRIPNDSQIWLNVCQSRALWANDIVKHAWMDDFSGMNYAVTSDKKMKFRNVIDVINEDLSKIKYQFLHNAVADTDEKKTYLVRETKDRSNSGMMTTFVNYGSTSVVNNLDGTHRNVEELQVKTKGYLQINSEVKEEVGKSRITYTPIDCGNTHDKFHDAYYQNQKILGLFTEHISVLIDEVSEVELFDPVIYRQSDADVSLPVKNTDVYIVWGKSIILQGATYYSERIELVRMSTKMKGDTNLAMPDTRLGTEKNVIPDVQMDSSSTLAKGTVVSASNIQKSVEQLFNINGALTSIANGLSVQLSPLANILKTVNAELAGLESALSNGIRATEAQIKTLVVNASAPLNDVLDTAKNYKNLLDTATAEAKTVVTSAMTYPQAVLNATLSGTGGVVSTAVSGLLQNEVLSSVNTEVKTLASRIDKVSHASNLNPANTGFDVLQQKQAALTNTQNDIQNRVVDLWNTTAAGLNKKVLTATAQVGSGYETASRIIESSIQSENVSRFTQITSSEVGKIYSLRPNYISTDALARAREQFLYRNVDGSATTQEVLDKQIALLRRGG